VTGARPADDGAAKLHRRGTHRACSPAATLARLKPHLAAYGITRMAVLTGLDRIGLPVVSVCRPNARSSAVFHGKGLDLEAARVSGLMEAIETWHAEQATPPLLFGSRADLCASTPLIDTDGLPRRMAAALPDQQPLLWAEGWNLTRGSATWIPFEIIHTDYRTDGPPASGQLAMTTNGLASGNTHWEAVSHALCELIERDATTLWRVGPPTRPDLTRVRLDTVSDPACRAVLDKFKEARLGVAAWEITTEVGVPAFQCWLADLSAEDGPIGSGAGCHPDRGIALLRALTEAAQVRMTYLVGAREDLRPEDYAPATRTRQNRAVTAAIAEGPGARDFNDGPGFASATFAEEVAAIVERLREAGFNEAVIVDLSRPDRDIAVVRAVVPFLEGSDHAPGFVAGLRARARRAA
jgi:YcaO-like protein with predicted kinase domain